MKFSIYLYGKIFVNQTFSIMNFPLLPSQSEIETFLTENIHFQDGIESLSCLKVSAVRKPRMPLFATIRSIGAAKSAVAEMEEYEIAIAEWDLLVPKMRQHNIQVEQLIRKFIEYHVNISIVPEQYRDKLWNLAWSRGHSSGYAEIAGALSELVEIFE